MNINVPVMVPSRSPVWENGKRIPNRYTYHPGPTITRIADGRVQGYFWQEGNATFDVKHTKYGFKQGSGDQYYFSDIGKDIQK